MIIALVHPDNELLLIVHFNEIPYSNIDMIYQKVKKSLNKLDAISNHFNSVILASDPIFENNIMTSDQNNGTINNSKSIPSVMFDVLSIIMILFVVFGLILKLSTHSKSVVSYLTNVTKDCEAIQ